MNWHCTRAKQLCNMPKHDYLSLIQSAFFLSQSIIPSSHVIKHSYLKLVFRFSPSSEECSRKQHFWGSWLYPLCMLQESLDSYNLLIQHWFLLKHHLQHEVVQTLVQFCDVEVRNQRLIPVNSKSFLVYKLVCYNPHSPPTSAQQVLVSSHLPLCTFILFKKGSAEFSSTCFTL